MKNKAILLALFTLFSYIASCQEVEDEVRILDWSETSMTLDSPQANEAGTCKVIRVVFHVVIDETSTFGSGEISENQIKSQIRAANQFFRNDSIFFHPDNIGLGYELALARFDPDGLPTNGINYYNGVELFGERYSNLGLKNNNNEAVSAGEMSQVLAWGQDINGKKYLNCYVVNRIDGSSGGGTQAFAYFPTVNTVYGNYNLHNVIGSKYFQEEYGEHFNLKTYTNRGLVWAHELLHNFAIFHTFQGNSCAAETNCNIQGDRVCDTEPQVKGQGCTGSCGFLSENVMDYISEGCKLKMTFGQQYRANLAIQNNLQKYLVCQECKPSEDGDFNNDGFVNILDFSLMNTVFGCASGDDCYDDLFDLDCSGGINILDVSLFQVLFSEAQPQESNDPTSPVNILGQRVGVMNRNGFEIRRGSIIVK